MGQLAVSTAAPPCPHGSRARSCPLSPMEAHERGRHCFCPHLWAWWARMLSRSESDVAPSRVWRTYRRLGPRWALFQLILPAKYFSPFYRRAH